MLTLIVAPLALAAALLAQATPPPAAALPTDCKRHGNGPCCDPAIAQHLSRQAISAACKETADTFLGERGGKDTCRYVFKAAPSKAAAAKGGTADAGAAAEADTGFVEIYAPRSKVVPEQPTDPFFAWAKVGKAFVTNKALSPKSAPMLVASTGIWLPGNGYYVSVNASTKVCTKAETMKLAKSVR